MNTIYIDLMLLHQPFCDHHDGETTKMFMGWR